MFDIITILHPQDDTKVMHQKLKFRIHFLLICIKDNNWPIKPKLNFTSNSHLSLHYQRFLQPKVFNYKKIRRVCIKKRNPQKKRKFFSHLYKSSICPQIYVLLFIQTIHIENYKLQYD